MEEGYHSDFVEVSNAQCQTDLTGIEGEVANLADIQESGCGTEVALRTKKKKQHLCEICGLIFSRTTNLRRHLETHKERATKISCPKCDATFGRMDNLRSHNKLVHEVSTHSYVCPHCLKGFGKKFSMMRHFKCMHQDSNGPSTTPIEMFKCDKCCHTSNRYHDLVMHVKIKHSTDAPFKCKDCSTTFVSRRKYRHHCQEKCALGKYQCSICRIGFNTKRKQVNY